MFHYIQILLLLIVSEALVADNIEKECYIDTTYNLISNQVIHSSNYLDNIINSMLQNSDSNVTKAKVNKKSNKEKSIDTFFRTKKFTTETEETYLSVKLIPNFSSQYTNKFNMELNARIPLSKSAKKYNFFINSFKKDDAKSPKNIQFNKQSGTEIGINYFTTLIHKIKSRYSLGVNGINLFTIARYSIEKKFSSWSILSSQEFKYSLKDLFKEETDIYFDKHLADSRLFRITLLRKTQEKSVGMKYALILQHYWILNKATALNLSQLFSGNTQYKYKRKKYRGITHYTTALNFRQTALRKWFYYGITPSINFDKANNYKANYSFNFYLEFYFGHVKK